jgi:hypothetical protein
MTIEIEHGQGEFEMNGRTFTWWLELHVSNPELGSKSTQLGGTPPMSLARLMAGELEQQAG